MTKLASYEAKEGKKNMSIGRYFRGDFISLRLLGAFLRATLAYMLLFALYILYDFEEFMANIYKIDLITFAVNAVKWYGVFVVVYIMLSYLVFTHRYTIARKSLKQYYQNLKQLLTFYK